MLKENVLYPWQRAYPEKSGLISRGELDILPDCAWILPESDKALDTWRYKNKRLQMNIVLVSPNEGEFPMRSFSYVINALRTIRSLRSVSHNLERLRIINPCYLNVYGNDGDLEYQLDYGNNFGSSLKDWIHDNFPDLNDLEIVVDQGRKILEDDALLKKAHDFSLEVDPEVNSILSGRTDRHSQSNQAADLYLYTHPVAWQYIDDDQLFDPRSEDIGVIDFMPQSEMLFILAMRQAGVELDPQVSGVVTTVSNSIISAPYYTLDPREPLFDWNYLSQSMIQTQRGKLRKTSLSGSIKGKEIMTALGNILSFIQTRQ